MIQRGYLQNPYHSSLHGADVLVNMYYFIKSDEFSSYLSDLDMITALVAAACHDYKHPGTTQNFHIETNSELALTYNGRSVLESMHTSETIKLLLKTDYNVFSGIKKNEFRYVRETLVDMILGTDMQLHSDHVKTTREMIKRREKADELLNSSNNANEGSNSNNTENNNNNSNNNGNETKEDKKDLTVVAGVDREAERRNCLVVGLHVADVGNPTKPWIECRRWTYMLMEEWYRQGDKERELEIDVSPMMDRTKPNVPRGQIGFIDYIIKPLFECWLTLFPETKICVKNLYNNRQHWEEQLIEEEALKLKEKLQVHDNALQWRNVLPKELADPTMKHNNATPGPLITAAARQNDAKMNNNNDSIENEVKRNDHSKNTSSNVSFINSNNSSKTLEKGGISGNTSDHDNDGATDEVSDLPKLQSNNSRILSDNEDEMNGIGSNNNGNNNDLNENEMKIDVQINSKTKNNSNKNRIGRRKKQRKDSNDSDDENKSDFESDTPEIDETRFYINTPPISRSTDNAGNENMDTIAMDNNGLSGVLGRKGTGSSTGNNSVVDGKRDSVLSDIPFSLAEATALHVISDVCFHWFLFVCLRVCHMQCCVD